MKELRTKHLNTNTMKRKTIVAKKRRWTVRATCGLLLGATVALSLQSCSDDVLTGQPEWLGNSIYERLQEEGNYSTVIRLIDDLNQREVLAHTGSRTLFVADDAAYAEWFKNNSWGVSSYGQLTTAQKKQLLNNAMVRNAYLIELMSNANVSGVIMEGMAMRRETATTLYDTIYVMPVSEMPLTGAWASVRNRGRAIPIMKAGDHSDTPPMIHFLPAYMQFHNINSEDLAILTNGQATSAQEAWVNGKKVVERDITCKNGYIQKMDGVVEGTPNMAEILRQHSKMSMWSHLVDRFSAPYFDREGTDAYNHEYNKQDSLFCLRYFSKRSYGGRANDRWPDNSTQAQALLNFDPGWNQYIYENTSGYDLHNDAGAMIVPTNEALTEWWNNQGRDLQDEYKEWDSIPDATLAKLINVNMLPTFSESVPSKFGHVLNDAKEVLGISKEDVDSCFMGCNGVVYMVNKVFAPAEYSSVAYPALAHESTMNIVYWGIDQRNFLPYLLSMDSKYALLLPNNEAMKNYIDPATYGRMQGDSLESPQLIEFKYDRTKGSSERVQATRYNSTVDADGNITKGIQAEANVDRDRSYGVIEKMFDDLVDQLIIVIPDKTKTLEDYVKEGYEFFKTKGGTLLRVTDNGGALAFEGGWQMDHNHKKLTAKEVFPKTNGRSYLLDEQMPLATQKSLYMTLKGQPEYEGFLNLLENDYSDLLSTRMNRAYTPADEAHNNKNLRLFDNYNYTVFIPSTEAIARLQEQKLLPTFRELRQLDDNGESLLDSLCLAEGWYDAMTPETEKDELQKKVTDAIKNVISDFVRYHVMDRSAAIGLVPDAGMNGPNNYESMKRNPETGRFFPLKVSFDQTSLTVTDVEGNTRTVKKREGLYNNIIREYWFQGTGNNRRLYMASSAVAHLIEEPLYYEKMLPWRQVVEEYLKNN